MTFEQEARAALDAKAAAERQLAKAADCPPWRHALFGIVMAGLVATPALPLPLRLGALALILIMIAVIVQMDRRRMGMFVNGYRRGKTRIDLDLKRLDSFGRQLDRTLDRVTVGIMTASLEIGSAIVLTVQDGPTFLGIPVLPAVGLFGYLLAFLNSIWIVYGIWRAGRE